MGISRFNCDECGKIFTDTDGYYEYKIKGFGHYIVCPKCISEVQPYIQLADPSIIFNEYLCFIKDEKDNLIFFDNINDYDKYECENVMFGAYFLQCNENQSKFDVKKLNAFHVYYDYVDAELLMSNECKNVSICWKNGKTKNFSIDDKDSLVQKIQLYVKSKNIIDQPFIMSLDDIPKKFMKIYSQIKWQSERVLWFECFDDMMNKLSLELNDNDLMIMTGYLLYSKISELETTIEKNQIKLNILKTN